MRVLVAALALIAGFAAIVGGFVMAYMGTNHVFNEASFFTYYGIVLALIAGGFFTIPIAWGFL